MSSGGLSRRDALRAFAQASVGFAFGEGWLVGLVRTAEAQVLGGTAGVTKTKFLTADQWTCVDALSEVIIPLTDTPGARAAGVADFIDRVLANADEGAKQKFQGGLSAFEQGCHEASGKGFAAAGADHREQFVRSIDEKLAARTQGVTIDRHLDDQYVAMPRVSLDDLPNAERGVLGFFMAVKTLTVMGYYTSDVGRQELGIAWKDLFHEDYAGCEHPWHRAESGTDAGAR
jgi:gluconate 2-dehydrogenase gamma chain